LTPLLYLALLLKASLLSTGGFGNLPMVHADFMARRWATDRQFAEALMVGQITPGPNGLWVVSFGYLTYGLRGALLASLAITLPPLLILGVQRLYHRTRHIPAVEGFVQGLGLAVVGVFVVVMASLLRTAPASLVTVAILAVSIAMAASRRVPVAAIILMAAAAGLAFAR
jgi:chromate transporter